MTRQEAKKHQSDIVAGGYKLEWWYGTRCSKCCEVFPKLMSTNDMKGRCFYQCEVCGRHTEPFDMPWQAEEAWNKMDAQMTLEI